MTALHTAADLAAALEASHDKAIVLFKHSVTCPFSAQAQEQAANAKHDLDIYAIVVQYCGDLSDAIAEQTGVEHASPQAIVVQNGKATWSGWRGEITEERLRAEVG